MTIEQQVTERVAQQLGPILKFLGAHQGDYLNDGIQFPYMGKKIVVKVVAMEPDEYIHTVSVRKHKPKK